MWLCFRRPVSSDATVSTGDTSTWKAAKEEEERKKPAFGWRCIFLSYKRRRASLRFPKTIAAGDAKGSSNGTICNDAKTLPPFARPPETLLLLVQPLPKLFSRFVLDPKDAKKEKAVLKRIKHHFDQTNLSDIQEAIYSARVTGNMQLWVQGSSIRKAAAERQHELSETWNKLTERYERSATRDNNISNPILRDHFMKPYNKENTDRAMRFVENCRSMAELDEIISIPRFRYVYSGRWSIHDAAVKRKAALFGTPMMATPIIRRVNWSDEVEVKKAEVNNPPKKRVQRMQAE